MGFFVCGVFGWVLFFFFFGGGIVNINVDLYKWIYLMGYFILLVFRRSCMFRMYLDFTFKLILIFIPSTVDSKQLHK